MRIYAYPGDAWGCGNYRVRWPALAAAERYRADVTVVEQAERNVMLHLDYGTGRVLGESFPDDADVVVMQRPTNQFMAQVIPLLRGRGVAVVVDMDDDLSCIDPRNPAFRSLAQWVQHPHNPRLRARNVHTAANAAAACREATLVTVTTPALAQRYGAHGRVQVIPNYVPERYLAVDHPDTDLVGWGGSVHSHPDDLQQVGPALARLVNSGRVRFETVGDPDGVARALGLAEPPVGPGPVGLDEWPHAIARFGVGIAPLAPTRFNQAKSRLKPLEYAAVGAVPVVSPAADYEAFARVCPSVQVVGKPRVWEATLRRLVAEADRRVELSEAGREVARQHTIQGNAWRWVEAWNHAVDLERARVPAGAA